MVSGTGHGFTSRQGPGESREEAFASLNMGLRTGEDPRRVKKNHRLFLEAAGLSGYSLVTCEQVHGSRVEETGPCRDFCVVPGADALITQQEGQVLSLFSADCALLFLVDRRARAVGMVHAGWRGAVKGIGRKAVLKMGEGFGVSPGDLLVGISPCIGPCCFEVREDVAGALEEEGFPREGILAPSLHGRGSWLMDLTALNVLQLKEAGVPGEQIFAAGICTCCRKDLFYSYRRDRGVTGRMMGYVYLDRKVR